MKISRRRGVEKAKIKIKFQGKYEGKPSVGGVCVIYETTHLSEHSTSIAYSAGLGCLGVFLVPLNQI